MKFLLFTVIKIVVFLSIPTTFTRNIFDSADDEGLGAETDKNELSQPEVTVTLVALKSPSRGREIVLTRCVLWDATVNTLHLFSVITS